MGAYLGRTKLEGDKGVMTDYVYLDGAKVPAERRRGEEAAGDRLTPTDRSLTPLARGGAGRPMTRPRSSCKC